MPIKPQAMQYQSRQCGWKTLHAPSSDTLTTLPPEQCEKCGSDALDATPAGLLDNLSMALSTLTCSF